MAEERDLLIAQLKCVAEGLGATLAPFCEVVLHDLADPARAILAIHNPQSGRAVGDPATELGLARIADPAYPQVIANYANTFADGRAAKSTSIGIRDSRGDYVAALCLNVDLTMFGTLRAVLEDFTAVDRTAPVRENLRAPAVDDIAARIDAFAARRGLPPHALGVEDRRALVRELKDAGCLEIRRAAETIAVRLGVSRATVYADVRQPPPRELP